MGRFEFKAYWFYWYYYQTLPMNNKLL